MTFPELGEWLAANIIRASWWVEDLLYPPPSGGVPNNDQCRYCDEYRVDLYCCQRRDDFPREMPDDYFSEPM
jgi:hypothetical protein